MRYHKLIIITTREDKPIIDICNVTWMVEALQLPPYALVRIRHALR